MTLLVARQCRMLRAPQGVFGALRRLQRPASLTTTRWYADDAQANAPTFTIRKVRDREPQPQARKRKAYHPITPNWDYSDIVAVNSATLIPASVTATVRVLQLYHSPYTCKTSTDSPRNRNTSSRKLSLSTHPSLTSRVSSSSSRPRRSRHGSSTIVCS